MSELAERDALFDAARAGDVEAFGAWAERVHLPLRRSLRAFARAVDVEVVVQETLLRMWQLASEGGRALAGEDASLRFALGVARNVAREEARRARTWHLVPMDAWEATADASVNPEPVADHGLRRAILECIARLPAKPAAALRARLLRAGEASDHELAEALSMSRNTFLQNIVRARRHLAECLRGRGVAVERWQS
jgi:DNA-directed RNA polymerase specialized sigma24 family protein